MNDFLVFYGACFFIGWCLGYGFYAYKRFTEVSVND
ncbi:hypothetical protein PAQU9191_01331 [Photobacterium aquimaris]|uniref:Uncharacterized protein n=2 Tax=Photobacterium TaxID=657 RepID=A0A1Y6KV98_9GAMM|nr:hypothetical protein PAQU9191_01331 [Photobacterium aquimaris]SMY33886.1 hypothetical protein PMAL9190_01345 [Photobacterium malacitanum]